MEGVRVGVFVGCVRGGCLGVLWTACGVLGVQRHLVMYNLAVHGDVPSCTPCHTLTLAACLLCPHPLYTPPPQIDGEVNILRGERDQAKESL